MGVQAVLFDYGHTLVDFGRTEEALLAAYEQIRQRIEAALQIDAPEVAHLIDRVANEVDRRVGESYAERRMEELDVLRMFDEVLANALGLTVPADVVQHIVHLDHSAFSNTITISDDNLAVLAELDDRGLKLGLISNVALLPDLMRADIQRLGIARHLDAAAFSSETGIRKPDPRMFRGVLEHLGVRPDAAVFVGDRLNDDVAGAKAVGMHAVQTREFRAEQEGPAEPDAVIDRLPELPSVLEGWDRSATRGRNAR